MSKRTQAARGAVRWHYTHGGYSYDPAIETKQQGRWRCARQAAEAEAWAKEYAVIEWVDDSESFDPQDCDGGMPDCGWCPPDREGPCPGHECEGCVLSVRGTSMHTSLRRIVDADADYRRVVEADLAVEAMSDWKARQVQGWAQSG